MSTSRTVVMCIVLIGLMSIAIESKKHKGKHHFGHNKLKHDHFNMDNDHNSDASAEEDVDEPWSKWKHADDSFDDSTHHASNGHDIEDFGNEHHGHNDDDSDDHHKKHNFHHNMGKFDGEHGIDDDMDDWGHISKDSDDDEEDDEHHDDDHEDDEEKHDEHKKHGHGGGHGH